MRTGDLFFTVILNNSLPGTFNFSETAGWEKTFSGIEDLAWMDDEIRTFLYYFEHSSIVRHHMMIHFKTLMLKDKELIETELKEDNESKKEDKNE